MQLETWIYITLCCRKIGEDAQRNRYYESRRPWLTGRHRRFVRYHGIEEASKVPAEWHAWLHHVTNDVPRSTDPALPWQKPHIPNVTGTKGAYFPPGHPLSGGVRKPATGDYHAWSPKGDSNV